MYKLPIKLINFEKTKLVRIKQTTTLTTYFTFLLIYENRKLVFFKCSYTVAVSVFFVQVDELLSHPVPRFSTFLSVDSLM